MNDREYKEARELYEETKGLSGKKDETKLDATDDEPLHSGGETEGSDFVPSDDELKKKGAKKRRKKLQSPQKEKKKTKGRTKSKEVETNGRKRKNDVIDVDEILRLGSKDNIGYPGGVLRMQYHSTAAVPDFFFAPSEWMNKIG